MNGHYYPSVALSLDEASELAAQHEAIERGLRSFLEMGLALRTIRAKRLYKATHPTFEAYCDNYCQERWGFGRRHAYQLIDAATTFENVRNCAQIEPASEAQTRPLTALKHNPELQRKAWQIAAETAPVGKVTGTYVGQVVDALRPLAKLDSTPKLQTKALQVILQEGGDDGFTRERVEAVVAQVLTDLPTASDRWQAENGQPIHRYKVVQEAADKAAEAWVQQQTEEELRRKEAAEKGRLRGFLTRIFGTWGFGFVAPMDPHEIAAAFGPDDERPSLDQLDKAIEWLATIRADFAEREAS